MLYESVYEYFLFWGGGELTYWEREEGGMVQMGFFSSSFFCFCYISYVVIFLVHT